MNENWTKFIEMYLQGELSQEDTAKLQVELDRNPEMRQSLELQKKIHEAAKRNGERELVKTARKTYQLQRTVKTSVVSVIVATAIATLGYLAYQAFENKAMSETESSQAVTDGKYKELDNMAELENLPISYFEHNGNDATFLSPNGIMLSVPEKTFLLDGKTYDGNAIIQFQEAINASDIVKAGTKHHLWRQIIGNPRNVSTQSLYSRRKTFDCERQRWNLPSNFLWMKTKKE